jgi:polar amino acid transport system substrate-binding protein
MIFEVGCMVKRFFYCLVFLAFALMGSCAKKEKVYRIGVDPSFFPIKMMGREPNVFAFSNEILQEIARLYDVSLERVNMGWDNLIMGLKEDKYEAMFSFLPPYNFNEAKYDFSDLYLYTGPVLIVRNHSPIHSMGQMVGKMVAVSSFSDEALLIENYPEVIVQYYTSAPEALNDIFSDVIDGVLVNFIVAKGYVEDLYRDKIRIASPPLSDEGLRLVTLHGKNQELLTIFNKGLAELRKKGTYDKLLKKWNLD